MRFGCCLNMISTEEDKGTGISFIETLAETGFDYAELPLAEMAALSENEFRTLRERLGRTGLKCEVCNNFFPRNIRLTGEEADMQKILSYVHHALGRAQALGVEYVVFGSGPAKNVPEGFPMEEGYEQVVKLLQRIDPIAGRYGITIVIEPLRRAECNLINTFEEGCRLAERVNGSHVKVLVDYYHMMVEQEPLENIERDGAAYLRHVHFANPEGRVYPKERTESDYEGFFEVLKKAGYNGRISCEAYSDHFKKDALEALKFLKGVQ